MRKNINSFHVEGYVYDASKLEKKISGEKSKHPGTEFYTGEIGIAVDEEGMNVIPVHFTYVTEFYSKSGKKNNTFTALGKIVDNPEKTWIAGGKDNAIKVKIDGNLGLNDFISSDDQRVSARRCEGSFVTLINNLCDISERNTFQADMVINRVNHVDADPEKNIDKDYTTIGGAIFNFRNDLLPVELTVRNAGGMKYFENLDATNADPVYTKVWGRLNSQTITVEKEEESAFGDAAVTTYERKNREWTVTGTAKVPYDFGDDEVMTADDLTNAMQNREVYWADIKKRNDEYLASKGTASAPKAAAPTTAAKPGVFTF